MEDQDNLSYDDLADIKKSRKFPLRLLLIVLIIVILLGGGAYAYMNGMIPFLPPFSQLTAQTAPEATGEVQETPTSEEASPTATASAEDTQPTDTSAPAEEAPAATEVPAEAPAADKLAPPEFGQITFTRATADADWADRAAKMAGNMAVQEPYDWEYIELTPETRVADVRSYYVQVLNKDMGYRMTFDQSYPDSGFSIYKFKQEDRRVTIQVWEAQPNQPPAVILFYEGW